MSDEPLSIRHRLDRAGILLSGLCLLHCVAGIVLIWALGLGSHILLSPDIHHVGLAVAVVIAAIAIGWSALKHRRPVPITIAVSGLLFMGAALTVPHGIYEAVLTIIGVILVSVGHFMNIRANRLNAAR